MKRTRIKFCGLCRNEDVRLALDLGVDALGFNLAKGPRKLTVERAAALTKLVPPPVTCIALFVDASEDEVLDSLHASHCTVAQLHGAEPAAMAESLRTKGVQVIKAFRVRDVATLHEARSYPCDLLLLDAWVDGAEGGTGVAWDWSLLRDWDGPRVMLAGGLRPDNVTTAVRTARPFAVDVSSGIELETAVKDAGIMRAFIQSVREADDA